MNGYVRVCDAAALPSQGSIGRVDVDGVPVALVVTEGELFAVDDTCSHEEVSLADGEVDGLALECWLHGSRFDLRTGEALCRPATKPVPVYDVKIEGDGVFVSAAPVAVPPTRQESNAR